MYTFRDIDDESDTYLYIKPLSKHYKIVPAVIEDIKLEIYKKFITLNITCHLSTGFHQMFIYSFNDFEKLHYCITEIIGVKKYEDAKNKPIFVLYEKDNEYIKGLSNFFYRYKLIV